MKITRSSSTGIFPDGKGGMESVRVKASCSHLPRKSDGLIVKSFRMEETMRVTCVRWSLPISPN